METNNTFNFAFAGTSFEVVASYGFEVFSLYQLSATRGREAVKSFTIGEGREDVFSIEHAALVAIDHARMADHHARMVA